MEEPLAGCQARPQTPDPPGRVLVVDDDPAVADVVRRYPVRDGHAVECVHDGYQALRRAAEAPRDLGVLDLMPTVTGRLRRLREKLEPDPTFPKRILAVWGTGYRYEREAA